MSDIIDAVLKTYTPKDNTGKDAKNSQQGESDIVKAVLQTYKPRENPKNISSSDLLLKSLGYSSLQDMYDIKKTFGSREGNPYPHVLPSPTAAIDFPTAETKAKNQRNAARYKSEMDSKKKDYDNFYKGENILQTALNKLGGANKDKREKIKAEYEAAADKYYSAVLGDVTAREKKIEEYKKELLLLRHKDETSILNKEEKERKTELEKEIENIRSSIYGHATLGEHIGAQVKWGAAQLATGFSAAGEFLVGTPIKAAIELFGGDPNIISGKATRDYINDKAQKEAYKIAGAAGDKYNIIGQLISNVVTNVPNMILACMTGGASTVTSIASNSGKIATGIKALAKNPMFWTSFAQTVGNDYEQAIEDGASGDIAIIYAMITSTINAAVEIGGGIETLPQEIRGIAGTKSALMQWIKSALDEGKEEVIQGVISKLGEKMLYDNTPITKDSIIDFAKQTVNEGIMGTLAGGLMGGGQMTFTAIVNAKTNKQLSSLGDAVQKYGQMDDIISYALKSTDDNIRALAESASKKGFSAVSAGQLYSYMCGDINTAISAAPDIEAATMGLRTIVAQAGADNAVIAGIAIPRYLERAEELGVDGNTAMQNMFNTLSDIDNGDELGYNNDEGVESYVRTDEFRSLQAEVQGMSDEDTKLYRTGQQPLDDGLRENISNIFRAQISSVRNGIRNGDGLLSLTDEKTGNQFNIYQNVDGELFHDIFEIARCYLRNGELVDLHNSQTTEDGIGYEDCINYLSEDGLSGFSITPDGDLISVFNLSKTKGFLYAIRGIVKEKVKTLDCYNSEVQPLKGIYTKVFDFKTASVMDYNMEYDHDNIAENHGEPQVAFMVNTDREVETRSFGKDQYDEAKAYRDSFIDDDEQRPTFREPDIKEIHREITGIENIKQIIIGGKGITQRQVEDISKRLGVNIRWDKNVSRGKYNPETGTITLNPDLALSEGYAYVFGHEFTHYLEIKKGYDGFKSYLFDKSTAFEKYIRIKLSEKGELSAASREDILSRYTDIIYEEYRSSEDLSKPQRERFTRADAEREMVADFVGEVLLGSADFEFTQDALEDIARNDRNIIRRFIDFVKELLTKLSGIKQNKTLEEDLSYLLKRLKKVYNSADKKTTAQNGGGEKYSTEKTFSEQIDDVINGNHNRRLDLYVSETPQYLVDLNFSKNPMLMRNGKILEILKKHPEMSKDIIKQIPNLIENPLLVLKSKTHPNESVVIIADFITDKGDLIIPIWVNQEGNYIDLEIGETNIRTNFVATSYGRNIKELLEYAKNNDGFLFESENKEKVRQLLARNGLQLPTPLKLSNSNIIVPHKDTISQDYFMQENENNSEYVNEKFSIAGEKARTANVETLAQAKKYLESGEDSETVRKKTGWFKSYDGKWRFEIDDSEMMLKTLSDEMKVKGCSLSDLIKHDKLFKAYPFLANIKVSFTNLKNGIDARYNSVEKHIYIDKKSLGKPDEMTSNIIHEIEHIIQFFEGFASGATKEYWMNNFPMAIEQIKKNSENILKSCPEDVRNKIIAFQNAKDRFDLDAAPALREEVINSGYWDVYEEYKKSQGLLDDIDSIFMRIRDIGSELYYETAGEIEARDVAERRKYTPEEREKTRPDIDGKNVVFTEGNIFNSEKYEKTTAENSGGEFDFENKFQKTLKKWDKKTVGFSFVVCNTSKVLEKAGIPNKQIRLDATKVKTLLEKHGGMAIETISKIPELLEKPIVVIDSKSNKNSKIIMGDLYDENGKIVTAVLLLTPTSKKGNQLDIIKISSIEGRSHIASLFKNKDGSDVTVRYVDEKRVQDWLNVNRLQLPLRSFNLNSNDSISNNSENVNEKYSIRKKHSTIDPEKYAKKILRRNRSSADSEVFANRVKQISEEIGAAEYSEAIKTALAAAEDVIEASKDTQIIADDAHDVLSLIRDTAITLDSAQKAEVALSFDNYNSYRRQNMGRISLKNDGILLESAWQEWAQEYPDIFDKDINSADMGVALANIVDNLKSTYVDFDTEAASEYLAAQIYNEVAASFYGGVFKEEMAAVRSKLKREKMRSGSLKRWNSKLQMELADERAAKADTSKAATEAYNSKQKCVAAIRRGVQGLERKRRTNSEKKHIPEKYKDVVDTLIRIFLASDTSPFKKDDLDTLYSIYTRFGNTEETETAGYDEQTANNLKELADILADKKLIELKLSELQKIRGIIDNIIHIVTKENEIFINNQKLDFEEMGRQALTELRSKQGHKQLISWFNNISTAKEWTVYNNLKPIYYFKWLGGFFKETFDDLSNAQGKYKKNMDLSQLFLSETKKKYHYREWGDKKLKFTTYNGDNLELTIEQCLLLYALDKREKTNIITKPEHLLKGGIIENQSLAEQSAIEAKKAYNEKMKYYEQKGGEKPKLRDEFFKTLNAEPKQITDFDINTIKNFLTDEQMRYADEVVEYLSIDMAELGNEVSMRLYGIRKYEEAYYIPFVSSTDYLWSSPGTVRGNEARLKHSSFTHNAQEGANNPLVLTDFTKVAADHIDRMCKYNAFTIPLENMNRIFNFSTKAKEGKEPESVKNLITSKFGENAQRYYKQFLDDANGGIISGTGDEFVKTFVGKFKKTAVLASASVGIRQYSAIHRAKAYVDRKYFLETFIPTAERDYQQLLEYSSVAGIKEMGRFDTGISIGSVEWLLKETPKGAKNKFLAFLKNESAYRDDKFSFFAEQMDKIAWTRLWAAIKAETADKNNYEIGSEKFLKYAGKRFDEVINYTQVYDSVISRSQIMRSNSAGAQMLTTFMAEGTTKSNMLLDAAFEFEKKPSLKNASRVKKTIFAIIESVIWDAVLAGLVYAARDDDEDETYIEKYMAAVHDTFLSGINPMNDIPILRDVTALIEGYDIERVDMSLLGDAIKALKGLYYNNKSTYSKIRDVAISLFNFVGLPAKNLWRYVESGYNVVNDFVNKWGETSRKGIEYSIKDINKSGMYADLIKAAEKDDEREYQRIYKYLIEHGVEESDIKTGVKKQHGKSKEVNRQADKYIDKLKGNDTYSDFEKEDKAELKSNIKNTLASQKTANTLRTADKFDKLYAAYRKNRNGEEYNRLEQEMLDSGLKKSQISDGMELARIAYAKSVGIDVHEYLMYKMAKNKEDADSKAEKRAVIEDLDVSKKTKQALLDNFKYFP